MPESSSSANLFVEQRGSLISNTDIPNITACGEDSSAPGEQSSLPRRRTYAKGSYNDVRFTEPPRLSLRQTREGRRQLAWKANRQRWDSSAPLNAADLGLFRTTSGLGFPDEEQKLTGGPPSDGGGAPAGRRGVREYDHGGLVDAAGRRGTDVGLIRGRAVEIGKIAGMAASTTRVVGTVPVQRSADEDDHWIGGGIDPDLLPDHAQADPPLPDQAAQAGASDWLGPRARGARFNTTGEQAVPSLGPPRLSASSSLQDLRGSRVARLSSSASSAALPLQGNSFPSGTTSLRQRLLREDETATGSATGSSTTSADIGVLFVGAKALRAKKRSGGRGVDRGKAFVKPPDAVPENERNAEAASLRGTLTVSGRLGAARTVDVLEQTTADGGPRAGILAGDHAATTDENVLVGENAAATQPAAEEGDKNDRAGVVPAGAAALRKRLESSPTILPQDERGRKRAREKQAKDVKNHKKLLLSYGYSKQEIEELYGKEGGSGSAEGPRLGATEEADHLDPAEDLEKTHVDGGERQADEMRKAGFSGMGNDLGADEHEQMKRCPHFPEPLDAWGCGVLRERRW